jgi:hypothetical protein
VITFFLFFRNLKLELKPFNSPFFAQCDIVCIFLKKNHLFWFLFYRKEGRGGEEGRGREKPGWGAPPPSPAPPPPSGAATNKECDTPANGRVTLFNLCFFLLKGFFRVEKSGTLYPFLLFVHSFFETAIVVIPLKNKSESQLMRGIELMTKNKFFGRIATLRVDGEKGLDSKRVKNDILKRYGIKVLSSPNYKCAKAENMISKWRGGGGALTF